MAEPQQNGAVKPQIPEGTMYMFVLFNPKTGEYACTYSSLTDALALHSMSATSLELEKRKAFEPPPAVAIPGFPVSGFDLSRMKGKH
jgi:hypothetical protein